MATCISGPAGKGPGGPLEPLLPADVAQVIRPGNRPSSGILEALANILGPEPGLLVYITFT